MAVRKKSMRKKAKPKPKARSGAKRKSTTSGRRKSSAEPTALQKASRAGRMKARLLERRSELLSGMENGMRYRPEPGTAKGDSSDLAADSLDSDTTVQLAESGSQEIAQIDKAIESIYNGTYGKCESCGEDIPWPRIEALPYATQCVKCKELEERKGSVGSAAAGWSAVDEFEALGED